MANIDNPNGLVPLMRGYDGGAPALRTYTKDAGEGTAIFRHDVVEREADGNIAPGGTPGTTRFLGVALNYGAASTETEHQVITSPDEIYVVQDNNDVDGIAAVDLGANANLEFGSGSATTKQSGHELDESTINTTASLDLKILAKHAVPGNDFGANCRVEVVINKHLFREGAGV